MATPPHLDRQYFKPKTALVVGPDRTLAATVATILPDWRIERACDNVAALAFIESRPFDLVVTGADTSGKADVDLLCKIRLVRPHTRLIILINSSVQIIESIFQSGFILLPPHAIHSRRGLTLQCIEALA